MSKVPEGIRLVARYGELHENHYEELFPQYDFMQMGAKDRRMDGRGSLTRKRTLLWTHPYILEKNQREHEEKEAEKQRAREAREEKERTKLEEDAEKQMVKEEKAAKALAREDVRSADIWQCMNLTCSYQAPATEEWFVCQYYKQKNSSRKMAVKFLCAPTVSKRSRCMKRLAFTAQVPWKGIKWHSRRKQLQRLPQKMLAKRNAKIRKQILPARKEQGKFTKK